MNRQVNQKVFVGLSGGVDSSVSAALLKQKGFDVTGVFIKIWQPEWTLCTMKDDRLDAMRVCAHLAIPYKEIDLTREYKKGVVDYMISEYAAGRTPNPDVMCNRYIKFGTFFKWAMGQGVDFVATGHYAQKKAHSDERIANSGTVRDRRYTLVASPDSSKDQTYFLWTLTQEQLLKTLFPVGHLHKTEVRKLATTFKLPTSLKKDSQGLCFVGPVNIKEFLSRYVPISHGNVLDSKGNVIGSHDGAAFVTIGERHGFNVVKKGSSNKPLYVLSKNIQKNTITVGGRSALQQASPKKVLLSSSHWISGEPLPNRTYSCQIRYHGKRYLCKVDAAAPSVSFLKQPEGISYGQSLVVYDKDTCVGGGVIEPFS